KVNRELNHTSREIHRDKNNARTQQVVRGGRVARKRGPFGLRAVGGAKYDRNAVVVDHTPGRAESLHNPWAGCSTRATITQGDDCSSPTSGFRRCISII